jgi:hypothetical protein
LPSPFRIDDEQVKPMLPSIATTLHQAALDTSATMPPVGASFGQSRHPSQWRSSVANSTPTIQSTHQMRQSTIEGSQGSSVYTSSSNISSDKPSGTCDNGANASSLIYSSEIHPLAFQNPYTENQPLASRHTDSGEAHPNLDSVPYASTRSSHQPSKSAPARKRQRLTEPRMAYPRKRAVTACQLCRMRKVSIDPAV